MSDLLSDVKTSRRLGSMTVHVVFKSYSFLFIRLLDNQLEGQPGYLMSRIFSVCIPVSLSLTHTSIWAHLYADIQAKNRRGSLNKHCRNNEL